MQVSRVLRQMRPPAMLGHLVDANSPPVQIIKPAVAHELTPDSDLDLELADGQRADERTLLGRSPNPGMARLPPVLAQRIGNMTRHSQPQLIRQRVAQIYQQRSRGGAYSPALEGADVDAQIQGLFLQDYVSVVNALRELQKRQPDFAPASVLDVGFGPATGLLAAREVFGTAMQETAVVVGHPRMVVRAKELLRPSGDEPGPQTRFRYDVPSSASPKRFDLIIATHQLYQTGKFNEELADSHAQQLARLASASGTVLFVERGDPLGFEAVMVARDHLLRPKYRFGVVGPCPHNQKCPLQVGLANREKAASPSRQNWCRFGQNVERPRFTKELKKGQYLAQQWLPERARGPGGNELKGGGRPGATNHEMANFSWVALRNNQRANEHRTAPHTTSDAKESENNESGMDPNAEIVNKETEMERERETESKTENEMETVGKNPDKDTLETDLPEETSSTGSSWPRILKQPYKRQRHVIMEVCTPAGAVEQWTVPRSQSRQAYRDVRKANAGDLWALDAKVKQARGGLRNLDQWLAGVQKRADTTVQDASIDWWLPKSNPHYKHGSHQARVRAENMVEPEDDSFVGVMGELLKQEAREQKVTRRELQNRYR